ncbi:MAG: amino acid-binding protein [Geobacteraceae bacterium]|nr:amino acid-binding protein [Geobacteraceae bacterium]
MKLKQLSIFLENSPGRLYEVSKAFGDAGINLRAHCICDTSHDFGVLRIIVSDLATARGMIMERHIPARVDEVIAAEIDDTPGSLATTLKVFLGSRVNVEYMYAVAGATPGKAVMIFRFSDNDLAIEMLRKIGVRLLDAEAFGILEGQG